MTSVSNVRKLATWNVTVPISDLLTVTTMDMLLWTALIKYHLLAHQHATERTPPVGMTDHHQGIIATPNAPTVIIGTGTGSVIFDPAHITLDTGITAAMTPTGVTPDQFIDPHIVALHVTGAPAHISTATTHHIADPDPTGISPEMTVDPECINPTSNIINQQKIICQFANNTLEKQGQKAQTGHN